MTVAVVGSSGYVAGALLERFQAEPGIDRVVRIGRSEQSGLCLDLSCAEAFDYAALAGVDAVVFTAAVSGPDKCASAFEESWRINVTGTGTFIREAVAREIRVLFLSSDAVFGDIPGAVYTESSPTQAETAYGRMKKAIEDEFKGNPLFKAIRLSYVVSGRDRFVSYCLRCIREGTAAEVFHPFYRNCISLTNVTELICWLLRNWDGYGPWVLNAAGPELVSRVRIADEINRVMDGRLRYTVIEPGEDFYRNRPATTQMQSLYLGPYGILESKTFTEQIQKELESVRNEL